MRNRKKQILCLVLAGLMTTLQPSTAMATNKAQAQQEKKDAQKGLDSANQKADQAQQQKNAAQAEVEDLKTELTGLLSDITLLEEDIKYKDSQIQQAQSDYDDALVREKEQYEAMKKRIRYMYEKGDTEYLDVLLKVKSMSDLLNKSEYISDIYDYDRKKLEEYQQTKMEVAAYKEQLQNDKDEMEGMQIEYKGQQQTLENTIAKKRSQIADFDTQLAAAKKAAAAYTQTIAKKNEEIRKADAEERQRALAEAEARQRAQAEAERKAIAEQEAAKAAALAAQEAASKDGTKNTVIAANPDSASTTKNQGAAPTQAAETTAADNSNRTGPSASDTSSANSAGPGSTTTTNTTNTSTSKSTTTTQSSTTKSSGGSAAGRAVADYGLQFVGNPYVYGGTSLTNGADCSGFVYSVYKHFGVTLPRTSSEQRGSGTGVSYADAQPGDLICYAGHIGIYIGNGKIVHASSPSTGIKVGNAAYRSILAVRRIVQ